MCVLGEGAADLPPGAGAGPEEAGPVPGGHQHPQGLPQHLQHSPHQ